MSVPLREALGLEPVARALRTHWRLWIVPTLVLVTLTGAVTVLRGARYTARAAFSPQQERAALAGLSSLAAQFGVNVPGGDASNSPDLYAELVRSVPLLTGLAADSFPSREGNTTLVAYYDVNEETPEAARARAVEALSRDLRVNVTARSGLVRLSVRTRDPVLSDALVRAIVERVNRFDGETRRTQARAEREFIETRIVAAREELAASEGAMERFLRANRDFSRSPSLTFEHDRLDRALTQHAQTMTSLTQDLERARLSEVRTTPVITVVEPPVLPALPDRRGLALRLLIALTGGLLLGGTLVLVAEWRRGQTA